MSLICNQAANALFRSDHRSITANPIVLHRSAVSNRSPAPIMVTGTFAFPRGYPNGSATWPTNTQNSYSSALIATDAQDWTSFGYETSSATPSHFIEVSPELTGYLHSHGKTRDGCRGRYLECVLQARDVDIENAPPVGPVAAKAAYANHGVVKINNVSIPCLITYRG